MCLSGFTTFVVVCHLCLVLGDVGGGVISVVFLALVIIFVLTSVFLLSLLVFLLGVLLLLL